MPTISDTDRGMIFNTINQISNRFTEYELEQIHQIALKLYEINKALIARLENSQL
jgi:hypothetical protein